MAETNYISSEAENFDHVQMHTNDKPTSSYGSSTNESKQFHETSLDLNETPASMGVREKPHFKEIDNFKRKSEDKKDLDAYNIKAKKYGKVILININHFYRNGKLSPQLERKGSSIDVDNLKKAFGKENLGMEVVEMVPRRDSQREHPEKITANDFIESQQEHSQREHPEKITANDFIESQQQHSQREPPGKITANDFIQFLQELAIADYKEYDMLVMIVMSHGENGEICTSDYQMRIKITDIISTFDNIISLENKPKIFIFQGCRGNSINWIPTNSSSEYPDTDSNKRVPRLTDCLILQATISGFFAKRNSKNGSWLITTLCQVLNEDWQSSEICSLLTRVNQKMSEIRGKLFENGKKVTKQMSTFTSTLTKKLYLTKKGNIENPGIDERAFQNLNISENTKATSEASQELEFYKLSGLKLGKAVIINIDKFYNDDDKLDPTLTRGDSLKDVNQLCDVFKSTMNMDLEVYELETTHDNIMHFIQKCADDNYDDYAMFLCIIMSYGNGNVFYASKYNGKINMDEIVHRIDKSTGLQKKPKIFVFQDCRNDKFTWYDYGTALPERKLGPAITEPHLADCLIIKSSPPDYLLRTDAKDAPCYINEFCTILRMYWKREDISTMLTRVNRLMSEYEDEDNPEKELLTASFESMLTKKLFFSEEASRKA